MHDAVRAASTPCDRGAATSLTMVLLTPIAAMIGFAALQAALWSHARTEARVIAGDTAALIARAGVDADAAVSSAHRVLAADADLDDVRITVESTDRLVTVTIDGDAPGIVRGTRSRISVTAAVPVERWSR